MIILIILHDKIIIVIKMNYVQFLLSSLSIGLLAVNVNIENVFCTFLFYNFEEIIIKGLFIF